MKESINNFTELVLRQPQSCCSSESENAKIEQSPVLLYRKPSVVEKSVLAHQKQNDTETDWSVILEQNRCDVVDGAYEGGLKLWECAVDLCQFLYYNMKNDLRQKRVIEMGCGFGLPGITTLLQNASYVAFQDFNHEALTHATKPNVDINVPDAETSGLVEYLSGDWDKVRTALKTDGLEKTFDLVLTSETIYNTTSYDKLHALMDTALNEHGKILLAAKQCYFGLSGSVPAWLSHVDNVGLFEHKIVWTSDTSVPRLIVEMARKTRQGCDC